MLCPLGARDRLITGSIGFDAEAPVQVRRGGSTVGDYDAVGLGAAVSAFTPARDCSLSDDLAGHHHRPAGRGAQRHGENIGWPGPGVGRAAGRGGASDGLARSQPARLNATRITRAHVEHSQAARDAIEAQT